MTYTIILCRFLFRFKTRVFNFGMCNLAGYLLPDGIVFSANGENPIGEDGGFKVGVRKLCLIVLAPRTLGCLYDRIMCARNHGCGLLPNLGR